MGHIYKASPSKQFTKVSNNLIRNSEVSDSAFRLICWIYSHNDGFSISFISIGQALGYGREKIRAIIKNAEANDYLVRVKSQNKETGTFDWDYHVFESPEDAIAFKEQIAIAQPGGANPSMVNDTIRKNQGGQTRMMVNQVGGVPYGGEAAPHKNIYISSFLEDLNSKDHIQEEARSHDSILEEKKATNLEQIELPNDSTPPTLEAQSNKINPSPSPLPATDSHFDSVQWMLDAIAKSNVLGAEPIPKAVLSEKRFKCVLMPWESVERTNRYLTFLPAFVDHLAKRWARDSKKEEWRSLIAPIVRMLSKDSLTVDGFDATIARWEDYQECLQRESAIAVEREIAIAASENRTFKKIRHPGAINAS